MNHPFIEGVIFDWKYTDVRNFPLVLILQFVITQFGGAVFETVALSAGKWIKMLATAFTVIILNEVIKAVKRAVK